MTIRCIAFDLDDTLWACKPVIVQAEQRFYEWLAQHYPRITDNYSPAELVQDRVAYMRQHPQLHHNLTHLRKQWIATLAQAHAYPESLVEAGFEVFWLARNEVTLFDGVLEVLDSLAGRFVTGVISNGNASVHHIGIGHLFDFVHSAEAAGVSKPDPEIFHQALAKAGVEAHQAVYVGDDPVRDVMGAAHAGWRTVWYNPSGEEWTGDGKPDATINHLAELESIVTKW